MALRMGTSHYKFSTIPCLVSMGGDIMYLIRHMTSHKYLIKGSCKFISGSSLWYVITGISIGTISIVIVEIRSNLLCDFA